MIMMTVCTGLHRLFLPVQIQFNQSASVAAPISPARRSTVTESRSQAPARLDHFHDVGVSVMEHLSFNSMSALGDSRKGWYYESTVNANSQRFSIWHPLTCYKLSRYKNQQLIWEVWELSQLLPFSPIQRYRSKLGLRNCYTMVIIFGNLLRRLGWWGGSQNITIIRP